MFRSQLSGQLSEPREKMVKVVLKEREKTYTFKRDDEIVTSSGHEIEQEAAARLAEVDPQRAERLANARQPINFKHYEALAAGYFGHAKGCKKSLDDCKLCRLNVEFFASLPLNVLSHVTEEKRFK